MPDLETQLRSYCEYLDEQFPAVTFEEIGDGFKEESSPVRPLRIRRGLAVALASAVVVLVLVGGLALLINLFGEEEAPVVTTPEPGPPTTIGDDVIPGIDEPDLHAELAQQEAFLESLDDTLAVETSVGTWTWRRLAPSDPVLQTSEPEPMDDHPHPGIDLLEMSWLHDWLITSASFQDTTVTAVPVGSEINWSRVFEDDRVLKGWWVDPERPLDELVPALLDIVEASDGYADVHRSVGPLLEASVVSGAPDAVEFRDPDTRALVLRLEATDPMIPAQRLVRAAQGCSGFGGCAFIVWYLAVDHDGNRFWIDPPWTGTDVDKAVVAATAEGFVAVAAAGAAETPPQLRMWASLDGFTWEELLPPETIDLAAGTEVSELHITGDGDRLLLTLSAFDPRDPYLDPGVTWTSIDGVPWQIFIDLQGADVGQVHLTKDDWLVRDVPGESTNGCEVWLPTSGVEWGSGWERIPLLTGPLPPGLGSQCHAVVGDTVIAIVEGHIGPMGYWRGGFADSSEPVEEEGR
jgi:hypothetical protein